MMVSDVKPLQVGLFIIAFDYLSIAAIHRIQVEPEKTTRSMNP